MTGEGEDEDDDDNKTDSNDSAAINMVGE